jgi:hypothetical protein
MTPHLKLFEDNCGLKLFKIAKAEENSNTPNYQQSADIWFSVKMSQILLGFNRYHNFDLTHRIHFFINF